MIGGGGGKIDGDNRQVNRQSCAEGDEGRK